jgi:hypothetical protein
MDVLHVVERMSILLSECAQAIPDASLQTYADRGSQAVQADDRPDAILERLWPTAHIVCVRLDRLDREATLPAAALARVIEYRDRLQRCIRVALRTLHPEKYQFVEEVEP